MRYCTFYVENEIFAVDASRVQEINRNQKITEVPGAVDTIMGLINLRGRIVTAIDMHKRLNLVKENVSKHQNMNIIVRGDDELIDLVVDRVGDVLEFDEALNEAPPETISDSLKELLHGVYKLQDKLIMILDIDKTIVQHKNDGE